MLVVFDRGQAGAVLLTAKRTLQHVDPPLYNYFTRRSRDLCLRHQITYVNAVAVNLRESLHELEHQRIAKRESLDALFRVIMHVAELFQQRHEPNYHR